MELRDLADLAGLALVLAMLVVGMQLCEWGLAADLPEPDDVDSVEVPSSVDVRVQGGGVRARRAAALAAERRRAAESRSPAPEPGR